MSEEDPWPVRPATCKGRVEGCSNPPSEERHPCVYAEEMGTPGPVEHWCWCCDDCQSECARDV